MCTPSLSNYQKDGVSFLLDTKRAILADYMGTGKTATAITACCALDARRVLVVNKKSLLTNWQREVAKWSTDPGIDWTITNYEQVVLHPEKYPPGNFDVMIVDEAAAIRNRKSKRSKAIRKLGKKVPFLWLLTGTPVVQGVWDLWALLNAINPKKYSSFWDFAHQHVLMSHNGFGIEFIGTRDDHALAEELRPVMLRRMGLELPPLTFEDVYVSMSSEQQRVYQELQNLFVAKAGDSVVVAPSKVALITRLRQVACTPALLGGENRSAKTDALCDLLEDITVRHKVLIFSFFAEYIKVLNTVLSAYNPAYIIGNQSVAQQTESEYKFNHDDSCRVLLGTIGAMGEGLNLQAADVVIFADQDWLPANNEQAWKRAHRRGQTKPVRVVRLITQDTVEEYVQEKVDNNASRIEILEHAIRQTLVKAA